MSTPEGITHQRCKEAYTSTSRRKRDQTNSGKDPAANPMNTGKASHNQPQAKHDTQTTTGRTLHKWNQTIHNLSPFGYLLPFLWAAASRLYTFIY
jgi:hypothetical protein